MIVLIQVNKNELGLKNLYYTGGEKATVLDCRSNVMRTIELFIAAGLHILDPEI
ncbi:MAG: hypothetical protein PHW43_11455 [Syntrophales bacterium]|nr:hypothetical protein [Syntrophales bacterium]